MKLVIDNIPEELKDGLSQITDFLNIDKELTVTACKSSNNSISINDGKCEIEYSDKVYFFRALSLLGQNIDKPVFLKSESKKIKSMGMQLDLSRNAVLTVDSLKKYMDYMALMGMNTLYLYIEDIFEVSDRPHFGYLRGRYSASELKEIDDYGYNYGIEVIPSIQTLGHHYQYLKSEESNDVKDTAGELLVDYEATYEFIESMIKAVTEPLRTGRIVIGMDETHTLGLGNYLKKNGYENPQDIFLRHLNRVYEITDKLGLEGIMYSDMFFNMVSDSHYYYDKNADISEDTINKIPKQATLIYWHYGEEYGCDDYMLEKHMKLGRKIIFYGGTWTWSGHLPETVYALDCTKLALKACDKYGVDEAVVTVWGDNGNECNHFYSLLTAQYAAEYSYGNEENYRERFKFITGAEPEEFENMSAYQNIFDKGIEYKTFMERFHGKTLFYQDILLGKADLCLKEQPMSSHYGEYAKKFEKYSERESVWKPHYEYISVIFRLLERKCYVAEKLQDAYKSGNRDELNKIYNILKDELLVITENCHKMHKKLWFEYNKPFGWEVLDIRYAGIKARTVTAYERIGQYLNGEINKIEELEEERLPYTFSPFTKYPNLATNTYEF